MTYATVEDLKAAIPERDLALLTDRDGPVDSVDDGKLVNALQDASAEIDGYISKRVSLPIQNPPRMLTVICRDLAIYRLFLNTGSVPETTEKLRDGSIVYLRDVASGKISIGDDTPGEQVDTSPGAVLVSGDERTMTRDSLKGF